MALSMRTLSEAERAYAYEHVLTRDFCPAELIPAARVETMARVGACECLGFFDAARMAAYAMLVYAPDADAALLNYLSVEPDTRGRGLGSEALGILAEKRAARGLILEVEEPDEAQGEARALRLRRIAFYERAGFRQTGVRTRLYGVTFRILRDARLSDEALVKRDLDALYRVLYPPEARERGLVRILP